MNMAYTKCFKRIVGMEQISYSPFPKPFMPEDILGKYFLEL